MADKKDFSKLNVRGRTVYATDDDAQERIGKIESLVPATATKDNQLADHDFVNSSVATNTANFKGVFASVSDLQKVEADNNDYAYVVEKDAAGNTVYNRYKYVDGTGWVFEYDLNNSSFTAAEWAAIQSGITAALVAKLQTLPTANEISQDISDLKNRMDTAEGDIDEIEMSLPLLSERVDTLETKVTDGAYLGMGLGTSSDTATATARTATISNFLLLKNVPVTVRFTTAVNVYGATLNISGQGAKPLFIQGAALQPGVVKKEDVVTMIYDGTNWNIVEILSVAASPSDLTVDLGLPSGRLWAIANIDATTPSGFAEVDGRPSPYKYECSFFSWGNTFPINPKDTSSFDYNWGSNNEGPYASTPSAKIQYPAEAGLSFDGARAILGGPWRDPSTEDFAELFANTTYINADGDPIDAAQANKLTIINGIQGIRLKASNGNTIFFPCSGYGNGQSWGSRGSNGGYWSRSLNSQTGGRSLSFYSGGVYPQGYNVRFYGFTRRAVQ